MANNVFKQYKNKLTKESWIKSAIFGITVASAVLFITAFLYWYLGYEKIWMCAIYSAIALAIVTPTVYFLKYKPTTKAISQRIDELGLEERLLTMTELEGDTSYIAMKQKEDALKALGTVHAGLIKLAVSVPMMVVMGVSLVCGAGMTTVSALSEESGKEWLDKQNNSATAKTYEIAYEVKGEGMIDGEAFQVVEDGKNANGVLAEALDGWVFVKWSDGLEDPYREDLNITANMKYVAEFQEMKDPDENSDGEDGDKNGESDDDNQKPKDKNSSDEDSQDPGQPDEGNPGGGESGLYSPNDSVIDGETDYGGGTYDDAYDQAMESAGQNGGMPSWLADVIAGYFGSIAK